MYRRVKTYNHIKMKRYQYAYRVSSRVPEIMAAGTHSPGGPNGIIRSQSFAGFSTLQERRSRCNSFMGNSAVQKKPQSKPKKPHLSGHKGGSSSREPQPKRLEEVYNALKQGLDEYLEVHQTELDKLMSLMKDMKRNSRLGVLYDLDKQIKTIERYMRRLEFHISKVDELYEAFCIQSRLREGASRMKQAFSSSPSTKGTKESIAEVNRRYKEYTENMSTFEGELENLLGEFHIKMKGLAGFARLCPGDQYEIYMRYGRQRWKLKGRIEVNSRQSWDGDEMVFMPLITDLINIKVTELKGLANHMLVGSVICETKELFTAMPQVVAVDVNDLGTIKLNLEVTWYPFDVEDLTLSSGNISKATALQRRVSVYSQGTPETPTFQDSSFFKWRPYPVERQRLSFLHMLRDTLLEKLRRSRSFGDLASLRPRPKSSLEVYSTLPDDVFENGGCGVAECKRLSFTFSDTSGSTPSPAPSSHSPGLSNPEITVTPPEIDPSPIQILPTREDSIAEEHLVEEEEDEEDEEYEEDGETGSRGSRGTSASLASDEAEVAEDSEWERTESQRNSSSNCGSAAPSLCSDGHLSTVAPEDVFLDHTDELKPVELDTEEAGSLTRQLVKRLTSSEIVPPSGSSTEGGGNLSWAGEGSRAFLESSLEEAIHSLLMRLESLTHRCRELQDLEQEVMRLEDLLKCRLPGHRSRSSSLSLTVESALESFDFLNTSDFDDDDTGDDSAILSNPSQRSPLFNTDGERIGGQHPEARGHLSEALTEDTGVGNSVAGSPLPLTTGNENLDVAIVIHLQYCNHLIQLLTSGMGVWQRRSLLLKMSGQTQLLEELAEISADRLGAITSAADVLPGLAERPQLMTLWSECSGSAGLFHTTLDRVFKHMNQRYTAALQERHPHSADKVIGVVVGEMVDRSDLVAANNPSAAELSHDVLTVFQFHSYILQHEVHDMETHLLHLAREEVFAEALCSGDYSRCLAELKEVPVSSLWPRNDTLRTLACLLTAEDPQVNKAAADYISSASHSHFRTQTAVEYYTHALSEAGVLSQRAACSALSCLQAVESIKAVVALCDSAEEELRHVAIKTLLTFGEEGRLAYEQLDTVPGEIFRLVTRRGNAITTAF
ncbi:rho family-interacting cell polarization regulator 2 isoform X3 [Etheostoma spectabile]|uniref:rho family-interacting cell polarization regulator 2 isoform X3 n=1 Tax=Etheostoma spectabile TaxID=54343 RepID=UPI0013AF5EEA|nr:rho family-interacting cell polarization regulator 2 isoform X3 [Etheostoma spectabile]